jgi:UDP-3-O-[3-hydroxymyristoyl] N-acetylglucosamine deacetylase/3-hydroxyacyl-[acyl-carrier-protein] dehydratase
MSGPRQRTITREAVLQGIGLHCGDPASVSFSGAAAGTGIRFKRADLEDTPEIPATLEHVVETERGTTLGAGEVRVRTVEHVLAAVMALHIDNLIISVDGPEVPIRDGSFSDFLSVLEDAGPASQEADARVLRPCRPVVVRGASGQSYVASGREGLRISATIDFDHAAIGRQFGAFDIDAEGFRTEVAAARTFGFKADAEALRARGLALGASLDNTVVLDDGGVMNDELRFRDEFVRHKVGDMVGDLCLLGSRLEAHIVAERPSHAGNVALARALAAQQRQTTRRSLMDTTRIMEVLPHRYPMLLVDRVVEIVNGERITGLKNVTINEPFFQGHYPGHPIMPGVLLVEALAQTGGLLVMNELEDLEGKVVYFMTVDDVKFRRPVVPGDTLMLEVEMVQSRGSVVRMRGKALVEGAVAAEAEFKARIMDA